MIFNVPVYSFQDGLTMRLLESITRVVLTMIGCVMNPVIDLLYNFIYQYDRRTVPPITDPILCLSAMALAKKIRSREVCIQGTSILKAISYELFLAVLKNSIINIDFTYFLPLLTSYQG